MNLLALDLGTHSGWASFISLPIGCDDHDQCWQGPCKVKPRGRYNSGVRSFDLQRGDPPGVRFLAFDAWLAEMLATVTPRVVVYEDAFMQPRREGTIIMYGFVTRIWAACASLGIESVSVNATRLKKWTTGDGWASKAKMLQAVNDRWHLDIGVGHRCTSTVRTVNRRRADKVLDYCTDTSHDQADAVALLHYTLEEMRK